MSLLAEAVTDFADDPEAVARFGGRMQRESTRLTQLVKEIIDLSRVQDHEVPAAPERVPVARVVEEAVDRARTVADGKGIELSGKTLGILGFGRIGQRLCVMAKAMGMEVIASDIYHVPGIEAQLGMTYVEEDELFARADFISLHTPAVDGKPLINAETIAKMKDGAVLINTSRGNNVDEDALLEALNSGKLRAAGLDVYSQEPPQNAALYSHPNVSCTPHIGAATVEAQKRIGLEIVDIIRAMG